MLKARVVLTRPLDDDPPIGEGAGFVEIARIAGRSRVLSARSRSPLRLLVPHSTGEAAFVYATSLGGGLVDGDAIDIAMSMGENSRAVFGTQGSTRAYRSTRGVTQRFTANVGKNAVLAVVPDPLVCFRQSSATQSTRVCLDEGGAAVVLDVLSAGRIAMNERWAFAKLDTRLTLVRGERTLIDEAVLLTSEHGSIAARMNRFDAIGTLLVAGETLEEFARAILERAQHARLSQRASFVMSASPLRDGGAVVKMAAVKLDALIAEARSLLSFLPAVMGDDPFRGKF